jgi:hypothetical protein
MDREETLAKEHLLSLGFKDENIVYEPDGNIPPDFLINGEVAIEVRRLNQHSEVGTKAKGLEVEVTPLIQAVEKMFPKLNKPDHKTSYFVFVRFKRPLVQTKEAVKLVKSELESFLKSKDISNTEIEINENLTIRIFKSEEKFEDTFVLGAYLDLDSGGWILSEIHRNLAIVIPEKERKVRKYKTKYPKWWLVLIDYIGYDLSERDTTELKKMKPLKIGFDKVILVSPLKPDKGIEIE